MAVSAPNMAVGEPFNIGITPVGNGVPGMPHLADSAGAHAAPGSLTCSLATLTWLPRSTNSM